jgi:hypothetical protein
VSKKDRKSKKVCFYFALLLQDGTSVKRTGLFVEGTLHRDQGKKRDGWCGSISNNNSKKKSESHTNAHKHKQFIDKA